MQQYYETHDPRRGKWTVRAVPHRGWTCVGTRDLNADDDRDWDLHTQGAVCEMCEAQHIRYVQTMIHENYPDRLDCGRVCAGNMETEVLANQREHAMKLQTERRKRAKLKQAQEAARDEARRTETDEYIRCDLDRLSNDPRHFLRPDTIKLLAQISLISEREGEFLLDMRRRNWKKSGFSPKQIQWHRSINRRIAIAIQN